MIDGAAPAWPEPARGVCHRRSVSLRRPPRPPAATRGFTLLEILLSIALIALLGGLFVGGSSRLLAPEPTTPRAVFWKAVQEARKTALRAEHEIRLKYDAEKRQFYLVDGVAPATVSDDGFTREERPLKTFPISPETAQDLTVEFLGGAGRGANTILVGGMLLESRPVPHVPFYGDGTCRAFRVQFARLGSASTIAVDPWTCAEMPPPPDPNAPPP